MPPENDPLDRRQALIKLLRLAGTGLGAAGLGSGSASAVRGPSLRWR